MVLVFYLASFVIPKALITLSRADSTQNVSIKNSFLVGKRIMAKADQQDKCVVYVFVLDADQKGIAGKNVELSGFGKLDAITDTLGKVTFELATGEAKQYELMASVDGVALEKTMKVTFR